jgi:hypothetical protein
MPKPQRSVPVKDVVTTSLDVAGVLALGAAGYLFLGIAGVLTVLGAFCLALSFALSRGQR